MQAAGFMWGLGIVQDVVNVADNSTSQVAKARRSGIEAHGEHQTEHGPIEKNSWASAKKRCKERKRVVHSERLVTAISWLTTVCKAPARHPSDGEGFEPPVPERVQQFSRLPP